MQAATLASAAAATPGLYGLDPQQTLLAVYPNATTSAIGPAHPSLLQAQQLSALDEANQILYFIGTFLRRGLLGIHGAYSRSAVRTRHPRSTLGSHANSALTARPTYAGYQLSNSTAMFTGLDLNTGAVTSSVPIPFSDSAFIGVGQVRALAERRGLGDASRMRLQSWVDPAALLEASATPPSSFINFTNNEHRFEHCTTIHFPMQMMAWEPNSQRLICGGQLADQTHVIGLIDPITGA